MNPLGLSSEGNGPFTWGTGVKMAIHTWWRIRATIPLPHVTCGLTACTPGSAPGPTLGNEYGKTLPLPLPYKEHKNLRNILVSSRFTSWYCPSKPTHPIGCKRCPNTRSEACNFIIESNSFHSTHNKHTFRLKHPFTCKSSNLVYLVTCLKCQKQYIGETGRTLAQRVTDHISCIRLKKKQPPLAYTSTSLTTISLISLFYPSNRSLITVLTPT